MQLVVQIEFLPDDNGLISLFDISGGHPPSLPHPPATVQHQTQTALQMFVYHWRNCCCVLVCLFGFVHVSKPSTELQDFFFSRRVLYLHIARKCHLAEKFTAQAVCLPHSRK